MTIAQYRALGRRYALDRCWVLSEPLYALRQMAWEAPRRRVFGRHADWLNPDGMRMRLDMAQFSSWELQAGLSGQRRHAREKLFDRALSSETYSRIAAAQTPDEWDSRNNALTILLSCPEFQRR